jgi:hypothetical protein
MLIAGLAATGHGLEQPMDGPAVSKVIAQVGCPRDLCTGRAQPIVVTGHARCVLKAIKDVLDLTCSIFPSRT